MTAISAPMRGLKNLGSSWWPATMIWLMLIPLGWWCAGDYDFRPGSRAPLLLKAPPASFGTATSSQYRLVCFLHPHCPCSRATVEECRELAERFPDLLQATAILVCPADAPAGWEAGELANELKRCPRIEVQYSRDGARIREYGATTSGQAFLFDPEGKCCFQGGLTVSRGKRGAGPGRQAIERRLRGEDAPTTQTEVYGCALE